MAVSLVADGEIETAQGVLDAAGVTLPSGNMIDGAYDEMGNFYQLPEPVVSDPINIVSEDEGAKGENANDKDHVNEDEAKKRREEKGKGILKTGDTIKIKARLSDRGGQDVVVTMGKDQNVRTMVRQIQEEAGVCCSMPVRALLLSSSGANGYSSLLAVT